MSETKTASAPSITVEGKQGSVRALVIAPDIKALKAKMNSGVPDLTNVETKELPPDEMMLTLTRDGKLIEPPFDKLTLATLPENSTTLRQCIEAMEVNIAGFGIRWECRVKTEDGECPPELKAAVTAEKTRLINFFNNCNDEDTWVGMRRKGRHDREAVGEDYMEILRTESANPGVDLGEIVELNHIPSYQIFLGRQDDEFTSYKQPVVELQTNGSVKLVQRTRRKRFRRYAQFRIGRFLSSTGRFRVRWFKDFLDPRILNNETGEYAKTPAEAAAIPEEKRAGELYRRKIYNPRTPYGLPRHVGCMIIILGDRAADETNYHTLRNNNVPSMAILVSNGSLTDGSIARIQEFVETQINGSDNYSRFLLVEAEGSVEGADGGHQKIDIKPLTDVQMRDQLFQVFGKNNADKQRQAYRLPEIYVGKTESITKASLEAGRKLADEQVFHPERDEDDAMANKHLLPAMGIVYHRMASMGPNVTDDQDLIAVLLAAEKTGGLTPRIARAIVADIMGKELPGIPLDGPLKPDIPFSMQLAEAVKNTAPMTPGAQVTALKSFLDDATMAEFMTTIQRATTKMAGGAPHIVNDLLALREYLEMGLAQRTEHDA